MGKTLKSAQQIVSKPVALHVLGLATAFLIVAIVVFGITPAFVFLDFLGIILLTVIPTGVVVALIYCFIEFIKATIELYLSKRTLHNPSQSC